MRRVCVAGTALTNVDAQGILRTYWYFLWQSDRSYTLLSPEGIHQLLVHPGSPVGRYPGKVVMPLGVNPEAVICPRECLGGADISSNQARSTGW